MTAMCTQLFYIALTGLGLWLHINPRFALEYELPLGFLSYYAPSVLKNYFIGSHNENITGFTFEKIGAPEERYLMKELEKNNINLFGELGKQWIQKFQQKLFEN